MCFERNQGRKNTVGGFSSGTAEGCATLISYLAVKPFVTLAGANSQTPKKKRRRAGTSVIITIIEKKFQVHCACYPLSRSRPEDSHTHSLTCDGKQRHSDESTRKLSATFLINEEFAALKDRCSASWKWWNTDKSNIKHRRDFGCVKFIALCRFFINICIATALICRFILRMSDLTWLPGKKPKDGHGLTTKWKIVNLSAPGCFSY